MSEKKKDIGAWEVKCWSGKFEDGTYFFITPNTFKKEDDAQPFFKISIGKDSNIGIWEKTSKETGKKYWGGKLPDGRFFSMFLNEYKGEGDKQPTFKILINEPKVQTVSFKPSAPEVEDDLPF